MNKKINAVGLFLGVVVLLGACSATASTDPDTVAISDTEAVPTQSSMDAMDMDDMGVDSSLSSQDFAPLVGGIYEGGEVLFIHTESSDVGVADLLTDMMGGVIVVVVPELADTPAALLAKVYVFTNGLVGHGPFGFQQDIFDSVPGDVGYRPLRAIQLVEWNADIEPYEIRTVADLLSAETNGEVTITASGIVVNMPILSWPGGQR